MGKDTIGILNKNEQMENSLQHIEALQSCVTIFCEAKTSNYSFRTLN